MNPIEEVAVRNLRPNPNNARTHNKRQIRKIAASIEAFGFNNPILTDDDYKIIAGHGRWEAAKQLKRETVPVVRLSHMTSAEVRAYALAENRLALEAGWDKEILAIELQGLAELDFKVELTGFETAEIDLTLGDANGKAEDAAPEPTNTPPVSRRDDIWVMDEHKLLCGDSRKSYCYKTLLLSESADFVFTDPPYNVKIGGHVSGLGAIQHDEFAMASGEMSTAEFIEFLKSTFQLCADHSRDGSIHQICMDWRHMDEMLVAGRAVYSDLKNLCVWNKTNAGMGSFYRSQHELVFVWKKGEAAHTNNIQLGRFGRSRSNVWTYAGVNTFRAGRMEELASHPTAKPVDLVADAVKDCTDRGDVVLDPFCGGGTILIACEKTGRSARGIEIDARFVDTAVRRWQAFTGKSAILTAGGESFDAVEAKRSLPANNNDKQKIDAA